MYIAASAVFTENSYARLGPKSKMITTGLNSKRLGNTEPTALYTSNSIMNPDYAYCRAYPHRPR